MGWGAEILENGEILLVLTKGATLLAFDDLAMGNLAVMQLSANGDLMPSETGANLLYEGPAAVFGFGNRWASAQRSGSNLYVGYNAPNEAWERAGARVLKLSW